jgi:anti-anti-sigma regulatory factor
MMALVLLFIVGLALVGIVVFLVLLFVRETRTKLSIYERQTADITILRLEGVLIHGVSSVYFRNTIRRCLGENKTKLIVNVQCVRKIDSAGLAELTSSLATVEKHNGVIKLLYVDDLPDLTVSTKLVTAFSTFNNEGDALRSFP